MKTLILAPETCNLAETTRMIQIAKACKDDFDVLFMSYGGEFEKVITEEGFEMKKMYPRMTPEKIERLYKIDKGEEFGDFFSAEELIERVENELALYKEVDPVAVVTGFCFSASISCRVAKVPLLWVIQSTWTEVYYRSGLGTYPDMFDFPILRWIPEKIMDKLSSGIMNMIVGFMTGPFNKAARKFGVKPFRNMRGLWEGDYTLMAEPPEFSDLTDFPPNYHFIGPLLGKLSYDIPEEILNMPKDKPVIYFAMGSSGTPEIVAKIIEGFGERPYTVIAPVKGLLEKMDVKIPENVIATGWIPAHKVNPMADISVIHGGIGTVMTACLSGTPVVGVGMQPEQEANIECLVRKGFAIRIKKLRVTPGKILDAVDKLLGDEEAKKKAKEFQEIIEKWDGPEKKREFFVKTFGGSE
ncbi:MAG: hypothetical protein K8T10_03595 [Candidatus Eremiobacteraeota bacterium]|nr:hypothetical protein [Candidatus Eremiobacteraeota bacterium]